MESAPRADLHQLIDRIYESAIRPESWRHVIEGLSRLFGGSPVLGELYLPKLDGSPYVSVGLRQEFHNSYQAAFLQYLPWSTQHDHLVTDRFRSLGELLPDVDLASNEFYSSWMKPQGLAPIWPVTIMIPAESGQLVAGCLVFRREGEEAFTEAEIRRADVLVSHIGRAIRMRLALEAGHRIRIPLSEALDRLPLGMLVLDRQRRPLFSNASAEQMLERGEDIRIGSSGLAATDPHDNGRLQELIGRAMAAEERSSLDATGFMQIARRAGGQPFSVMISPLLAASDGSLSQAGVVAVFISDPEADHVPDSEALSQIYQLTRSEAEIVQLLARGLSLEQAAADRGISMNTARSHLKHVFTKTGTSRQSELLGLVMSGVGSIRSR